MKRKPLSILALKVESFDSDCFTRDIVDYNPNSMVLLLNFKGVRVAYSPQGKAKFASIFFRRFKHPKLNYYLLPLLFALDYLRISWLLLSICLKYFVGTIIVENTHLAVVAGLFRRLRLVKKMIYLPGDWLAGSKTRLGGWSFLGNEVIFPLCDYLSCKGSDLVLDCTPAITAARKKFWGRKIYHKGEIFPDKLEVKGNSANLSKKEKKIVFMGTVRRDSGLEVLIASLGEIKKRLGVSLKLVGSTYHQNYFLKEVIAKYQAEKEIEFLGFVERGKFKEAFSDCFCGVNLLMEEGSYTVKTLPAKIYDYLQYLLPVIVTENIGPIARTIQKYQLGLVIKPTEKDLLRAIKKIYNQQQKYRQNIIEYINFFPGKGIKEFLKD